MIPSSKHTCELFKLKTKKYKLWKKH
jgi:hypothetical protein